MNNLWTPWRFHYLRSGSKAKGCIFCRMLADGPEWDRQNLVLVRDRQTLLVLNRFPYTAGHLLIVPRRHVASLVEADPSDLAHLLTWARESEGILRDAYAPDGFNIGMNLGRCAGAGVAGHLHLHVVPRWIGDANSVSIVGQTRIIPEELEATFDKLRSRFQNVKIDRKTPSPTNPPPPLDDRSVI